MGRRAEDRTQSRARGPPYGPRRPWVVGAQPVLRSSSTAGRPEDVTMAEDPTVLDEAYERLAVFGFDEPRGFVNHAPMGCEALAALGRPDDVDRWSRTPDPGNPALAPRRPGHFVWEEALGDGRRTAEWLGYFDRAVTDDGWAPVVALWVPRLLPGLAAALFHGAIRTAPAVRAAAGADTPARRAEVARSLG